MSQYKGKSETNKYGLSRNIPEEVKRQIRRRCGFGCVICGLGIYEYEHFNPDFTQSKTHDADGITLLCPNHHTKKTIGKLSLETIKQFNSNPKALRRGTADEQLDLRSQSPIIVLGGSHFKINDVLIQIEDEPLLMFKHGQDKDEPLLLNATIRDRTGKIIMQIVDNEWRVSSDNWDVRSKGKSIEIRSAARQIDFIMRQEPPHSIYIDRLQMHHKGYQINAYKDQPLLIVNPSGRGMEIMHLSGTGGAGLLFYGNSVAGGLSPHVSIEDTLAMMKRVEEGLEF